MVVKTEEHVEEHGEEHVEEHGEEHGPTSCRVLNCSIDSLLLEPLLHCARPFF